MKDMLLDPYNREFAYQRRFKWNFYIKYIFSVSLAHVNITYFGLVLTEYVYFLTATVNLLYSPLNNSELSVFMTGLMGKS